MLTKHYMYLEMSFLAYRSNLPESSDKLILKQLLRDHETLVDTKGDSDLPPVPQSACIGALGRVLNPFVDLSVDMTHHKHCLSKAASVVCRAGRNQSDRTARTAAAAIPLHPCSVGSSKRKLPGIESRGGV